MERCPETGGHTNRNCTECIQCQEVQNKNKHCEAAHRCHGLCIRYIQVISLHKSEHTVCSREPIHSSHCKEDKQRHCKIYQHRQRKCRGSFCPDISVSSPLCWSAEGLLFYSASLSANTGETPIRIRILPESSPSEGYPAERPSRRYNQTGCPLRYPGSFPSSVCSMG